MGVLRPAILAILKSSMITFLSNPERKVNFYMGESILAGRGSSSGGSEPIYEFVREVITENKVFTMPVCENQSITVKCFGGGGGFQTIVSSGLQRRYAGGSGNYNKNTFTIDAGTQITINIGVNGINGLSNTSVNTSGSTGGTTKFGTYISATGGRGANTTKGGDGGAGGAPGGKGYWFGSAGNYIAISGGNFGGSGGILKSAVNTEDYTNKNAATAGDGTDTRLMNDIESEFKGYANGGETIHKKVYYSGNYYGYWVGGGSGGWGCKGGVSAIINNNAGGMYSVGFGGGGGYGCDGGNGSCPTNSMQTHGNAGGYGQSGRAGSGQAGICILEYMIKR